MRYETCCSCGRLIPLMYSIVTRGDSRQYQSLKFGPHLFDSTALRGDLCINSGTLVIEKEVSCSNVRK